MTNEAHQPGEVTYHAADRGATCSLGCIASLCFILGIGMGLWFIWGGIWKAIVAVSALLSGIGLVTFLRSPTRGRWEVTFDPEARVVRYCTRVRRRETTEKISYDEVDHIALAPIERETSRREVVTFQLPVIHLKGGREPIRFDERLSIRDPERAEEVLKEMNELLGLD